MKYVTMIFLIISTVLMSGCSEDDAAQGTIISVTIDGTDYSFSCFRNQSASSEGYEYSISCEQHAAGESKRLTFYKAYEANGGEVKVNLTDVPDSTLFDSPYGIQYSCSDTDTGIPCPVAAPTFDAATTTFNLTDVELPETWNRTVEYPPYVAGVGSHTMTTSIEASGVPYF